MKVWRWTAKDKDGKPWESAPGMFAAISRGPMSEDEMQGAAQQLLNHYRQLAVQSGAPDPGLKVDTIEEVGTNEAGVGQWAPAGVAPLNIKQFANAEPGDEY